MRAAAIALASICLLFAAREAQACGCFTPPDPTVSIVQAGERIVFARRDGKVTAHIQIQYQGDAREFGWLLPLPSVPELQLGVDELFTQLARTTQPSYRLRRVFEQCSALAADAGPALDALSTPPSSQPPVSVLESSIGPYDYAVLRAGDREAMLAWLRDNRYFVPVGTEDVVAPYIHPGAYFLALKLRTGLSVGDLQPIVVSYASDLPMIPIVLTSVAAKPDMGIQVWVLGEARAVPRNYAHTVLDDAAIDWLNGGARYNDLVIRATREAPGRHTFVTEYAGSSAVMRDVLDPPWRFDSLDALSTTTDVFGWLLTMNSDGYAYTTQLLAILQRFIPVPPKLAVSPAQFYAQPAFYRAYAAIYPQYFEGWSGVIEDPYALALELYQKIVEPTQRAGALFRDHPYLTRLYTTLSPEDMTRDPVFTENRFLPGVSNVHTGTLTYHCGGRSLSSTTPATLVTEQGFVIEYPTGVLGAVPKALPGTRRLETILEEGPPSVLVDNDETIAALLRGAPVPDGGFGPPPDAGRPLAADASLPEADRPPTASTGGGGCSAGGREGGTELLPLALLAAWAIPRRRRPSRRRPPPPPGRSP